MCPKWKRYEAGPNVNTNYLSHNSGNNILRKPHVPADLAKLDGSRGLLQFDIQSIAASNAARIWHG